MIRTSVSDTNTITSVIIVARLCDIFSEASVFDVIVNTSVSILIELCDIFSLAAMPKLHDTTLAYSRVGQGGNH